MKKILLLFIFGAIVVCAVAAMARPSDSTGTDPLHNSSGTKPGLGAVPDNELKKARKLISKLHTAPSGSMNGYSRALFGSGWTEGLDVAWGHDGCRTRDDILRRDLDARTITIDFDHCTVLSGYFTDPYTNRRIEFRRSSAYKVQIDHVVPLAYAYRMGIQESDRKKFANDPRNLLTVDGPANESKSDDGPSKWTPIGKNLDCAYSVKFAQVARIYEVPVEELDKKSMINMCE